MENIIKEMNYEIIDDFINPKSDIYIASSSPIKNKIGSGLIKWYQKTSYSHVFMIYGDFVFQASHGLVNVWHIENFLKENKIIDKIKVEKETIDFSFMLKQLGKLYGYSQLIEISLRYIFVIKLKVISQIRFRKIFKDNKDRKYTCSEYMGRTLKLAWVNDDTTPKDIIEYIKLKLKL